MPAPNQKNIVHGSVTAGGDVHIGDIHYNIARDFRAGSILFLRLEKEEGTQCLANLSVKSKHSTQGSLDTSGVVWCEKIVVNLPPELFKDLADFQNFRRKIDAQTRYYGIGTPDNHSIQALEKKLGQLIFQAFFSGHIGKVCAYFIELLEAQRIEELLIAVSADEETIINLPFEMALPFLFPPKSGEAKRSLAVNNFGLVRTKVASLDAFNMQGQPETAAPLKMLFITALPENLDERGKMLQIEEEKTRLIQSIGALEATGDHKPKIVIEFLENASLTELDKALHDRQHNIVHISGHGAYHAAQNKGVLYFENEDGDEEQISGAALGETLRKHACVKLLILSACETAIAGSEGGVTEQAAAFGVPSIVAMRFAVTDEGAKVFTTELYTQLAKGLSLTRALAYGREALLADIVQRREQSPHILHIAEWFTPVVYQNQSVGALIDKTQPYQLPDDFYPHSSFLKTKHSRLIGEGFIGRKRYLIQMRQAFRAGRHICLHGLGGLGKTTLAEAFAHNYAARESGTVIVFRSASQINEAYILQNLNNRFAKLKPDLAEQIQQEIDDPQTNVLDKLQLLIDNYLNGRNTILIFDNVEDVQTDEGGSYQRSIASQSLSSFLRHLSKKAPNTCHLIFTTRYKLEDLADVVEHLALDKMCYAEQYRLLNYSKILRGIPIAERDGIYKRLDGHPRGYEFLKALLEKDPTFSWQQVNKAEVDVFEDLLLSKVYERLNEREKTVFQILSVFISRSPLAALAAVSGESEAELMPLVQSLQDWSLCFLDKEGGFEVHRLTREWMAKHKTPSEKMKEWALRAGEYFESQPTWGDVILAKDYFELAEAWQAFARTSFRLQKHYQLIGLYLQAFVLNLAVLEKNVKEESVSIALFNIGAVFKLFGQHDQALELYEQSLAINKKIGDRAGEGATLNNLGSIAYAKGDNERALGYLEKSLSIYKEIGDRVGEGVTLNNISQIYTVRGDNERALGYLEKSLSIQQEIGDRAGEGTTLNNISLIYKVRGDNERALGYLEKSLRIQQEIGDRAGEGATLNNLGSIAYAIGDYEHALGYLEKSLSIQQEIGNRETEGATLNNISQIYKVRGDYERAFGYLEKSLSIQQEIGDRAGEGVALNNISQIYVDKGENDIALRYLEKSLAIAQEIGDRKGEGATLNNISQIYKVRGDNERALGYLEKSLSIYKEIGDRAGEGTTLNNISLIYKVRGDNERAMGYLEKSLSIQQEIGDMYGMAVTLTNIGVMLFEQKSYEGAKPLLIQARDIFQKIGSPDIQSPQGYLDAIYKKRNSFWYRLKRFFKK